MICVLAPVQYPGNRLIDSKWPDIDAALAESSRNLSPTVHAGALRNSLTAGCYDLHNRGPPKAFRESNASSGRPQLFLPRRAVSCLLAYPPVDIEMNFSTKPRADFGHHETPTLPIISRSISEPVKSSKSSEYVSSVAAGMSFVVAANFAKSADVAGSLAIPAASSNWIRSISRSCAAFLVSVIFAISIRSHLVLAS